MMRTQVLNAVERDLRAHYKSEYRVVKAVSGQEALEAVRQLEQPRYPFGPLS